MIDEPSRRLPTFDLDSIPVVMGDGQSWHIPRPGVTMWARFKDAKCTHAEPVIGYGRELDELVKAVAATESMDAMISGVASLAEALLRQNYSLSHEDLDQILFIRPDDPTSAGWIEGVMQVVAMEAR